MSYFGPFLATRWLWRSFTTSGGRGASIGIEDREWEGGAVLPVLLASRIPALAAWPDAPLMMEGEMRRSRLGRGDRGGLLQQRHCNLEIEWGRGRGSPQRIWRWRGRYGARCLTRRGTSGRQRGIINCLKGYGIPPRFLTRLHTRKTFCNFSESCNLLQKTRNL